MIKHLLRNPIALLALFISLGGTSYAANSVIAPAPSSGPTTAYASIWFVNHNSHELHVEADKSSGITAANLSYGADNTVCLNGLPKPPRNVQVTSHDLKFVSAQIAPTTGACAGKQARISFYYSNGTPTIYGSFFVTVLS